MLNLGSESGSGSGSRSGSGSGSGSTGEVLSAAIWSNGWRYRSSYEGDVLLKTKHPDRFLWGRIPGSSGAQGGRGEGT